MASRCLRALSLHHDFFAARISYQKEASQALDRHDAAVTNLHRGSEQGFMMLGKGFAAWAP